MATINRTQTDVIVEKKMLPYFLDLLDCPKHHESHHLANQHLVDVAVDTKVDGPGVGADVATVVSADVVVVVVAAVAATVEFVAQSMLDRLDSIDLIVVAVEAAPTEFALAVAIVVGAGLEAIAAGAELAIAVVALGPIVVVVVVEASLVELVELLEPVELAGAVELVVAVELAVAVKLAESFVGHLRLVLEWIAHKAESLQLGQVPLQRASLQVEQLEWLGQLLQFALDLPRQHIQFDRPSLELELGREQ